MSPAAVHRELILPSPAPRDPSHTLSRATLTLALLHASWLEVHRSSNGAVRFHLGATRVPELGHTLHCLAEVYPGLELGRETACPFAPLRKPTTSLLRAVPAQPHHFWPMQLLKGADRAGMLVRSLSSRELDGHDILLQVLFRRVPYWESGFLGSTYDAFVTTRSPDLHASLTTVIHHRKAEPAYHVEIRAAVSGPDPDSTDAALLAWLRSWTSERGNPWWRLVEVAGRKRPAFLHAFRDHSMDRCSARKGRRDLSATELAQVLPIPWRERHAALAYAGAPAAMAPPAPPASPAARPGSLRLFPTEEIRVGHSGGETVYLPRGWHHLAILGKTRTGKSTLALNVASQILAHEPAARVVVLEPTGTLVESLMERLPPEVAGDTVEIDPSHPTTERDGVELAKVPLNLLHLQGRRTVGVSELERRAERVSGDLLQAIRNAWGEESIGGRAEFVLRAVIQGLLAVEGTNLVDAYSALSDRKLLQRLERLARGAQLKRALRVHLPKLDYSFTISSLDKVGKVATNPLLRKALCQRYHATSFEQLLRHRLLLLNLAKGALGTEASTFLGAVFLTQLWSTVQELPPPARGPIYLVVDEFHNFAIPAFADMLSEGARLGLHVVAITQYLDRIPPKVRSALVGNVDAWAFFAVGAEDARAAWEIAQGAKFGWRPEHFSSGLAPHQAALATRDSLCRVDTFPGPTAPSRLEQNRRLVEANVHRYSHPEDSEVSPLAVSTRRVETFLAAFPEDSALPRGDLAARLGWSTAEVDAALALSIGAGDVADGLGSRGVEFGLRARGLFHRQALAVARNEGEEHCGLLADAGAYLLRQGVRVHITAQEGGYLRPDGEFGWGGRDYHLEVECSTLIKRQEQVARNLRKALAAGRRCLVVVPDEELARLFASVLKRELPRVELWREVGLLWREDVERLVPYTEGSRLPWGFLPGGVDPADEEVERPPTCEESLREATLAAVEDPNALDLTRVHEASRRLARAGKSEAVLDDFQALFQTAGQSPMSPRRLGMALASLKVPSRRVVQGASKVRVYDLRGLLPQDQDGGRPVGGGPHEAGQAPDKPDPHAPADGPEDRNGPTYTEVETGVRSSQSEEDSGQDRV